MGRIRTKCTACDGAGVIKSKAYKSTAVLCKHCSGDGYYIISYEPFVKRKKLGGIKQVKYADTSLTATSYSKFFKEGPVSLDDLPEYLK